MQIMRRRYVLIVTILLGMSAAPYATVAGETVDKPVRISAEVVQVSATVEALDKEMRTVTLKGPEGNTVTFTVGEEVRNFD